MSETERTRPKPYRVRGYGILNPYGDIWSPQLFGNPGEARAYVESFWRDNKTVDPQTFRIVRVEQKTAYIADADEGAHP